MAQSMSSTRYFYIAAVVISVVALYFINAAVNQPQPAVSMTYNAAAHFGKGYVDNNLAYPIEIVSVFCTSDGNRETFGTPNNNILMPGTNTLIEIGASGNKTLPSNCTDWGVSYNRLPANTTAPNSLIKQG